MRKRKPRCATSGEVKISRDGETAIITYNDPEVATTHFRLGPQIAGMTDAEILDCFNQTIQAQEAFAASYHHVAVEVPPGRPQIEYFADGDQWTPRGGVLRCVVAGAGLDDADFIYIDDQELGLKEFGKLLSTYAGWGMRITFVPEDRLEEEPEIEVREPD